MQKLSIALFLSTFFLQSCGGKDEKKDSACEGDCLGNVRIVTSSAQKIEVSFKDAVFAGEHVVMPYSIGDLATVDGAGKEQYSYDVSGGETTEAGVFSVSPKPQLLLSSNTSFQKKQQSLAQLIWNRWNPKWGIKKQAPGFWELVKAYDKRKQQEGHNLFDTPKPSQSLFSTLYKKTQEYTPKTRAQNLLAASCPDQDGDVIIPTADGDTDTIEPTEVVAGSGYCIIYKDPLLAETDKAAIKNSIETILSTYKTKIYGDNFPPVGGFTFLPHFVFLDTTKAEYGMHSDFKKFLGAFHQGATEEAQVPMLYIATDLSKIEGLKNDDAGKASVHATLAHELQHAISSYYRSYALVASNQVDSPVTETLFIDEGLAHFMEDIFGYGSESFDDFAGNFISTFRAGLFPFLGGSSLPSSVWSDNFNTLRGGAQVFLYYLSSQKGGVTFEDGVVSGGGGLSFLRDITRSTLQGANNLKTNFAGSRDWVTVVGHFLSALVLDNTNIDNVDSKFTVQAPFNEVKDLQNTQNKIFGMRYNDFRSLIDVTKDKDNSYFNISETPIKLYNYHTKPGLYKVNDISKPYVITTESDTGTAAAIVRIR